MSISGGLMSVSGRFGADTRQSLLREHEARPCRPPFRYTRTNNLHFAVIPGCTSARSAGIDLWLVTAAIKNSGRRTRLPGRRPAPLPTGGQLVTDGIRG